MPVLSNEEYAQSFLLDLQAQKTALQDKVTAQQIVVDAERGQLIELETEVGRLTYMISLIQQAIDQGVS